MKIISLVMLTWWTTMASVSAASPIQFDAAAQCTELGGTDFSGIQDAPTQVISARLIGAKSGAAAYCQIDGYVSPQVGFEVRLPSSTWNGKFLVMGNGGWAGNFDADDCNSYMRRGYACLVSDAGHKGRGDDGLWAQHNLPAQIDFGFRGIHVSTLAGKQIVERFYSRAPQRSYFIGCSTGGYQGLVEAQRFPWDFDGIVAGSPDMDEADLVMRELWSVKTFLNKSGQPVLSPQDTDLVHRAALAACDMDDGVKDGIISSPTRCRFDPATLLCKAGKNPSCLTQTQVAVVKSLYAGPMTSSGVRTSSGGVLPGSELSWKYIGFAPGPSNAQGLLSYMIYGASPEWKPKDFDFNEDYKRLGLAALYTDTNPDLRKFKAAGGKLIAYQGGNDFLELPGGIVDYYETTEKTMGGRASTQDFFRFFMIPGMSHCTGDVGAFAIDYLRYLEQWVEQRKAPDAMIGAHVSDDYLAAAPLTWDGPPLNRGEKLFLTALKLNFPLEASIPLTFTRPIYPYPDYAVWTGKGDPNKAENFRISAPPKMTP